jgi:hypothetical protein
MDWPQLNKILVDLEGNRVAELGPLFACRCGRLYGGAIGYFSYIPNHGLERKRFLHRHDPTAVRPSSCTSRARSVQGTKCGDTEPFVTARSVKMSRNPHRIATTRLPTSQTLTAFREKSKTATNVPRIPFLQKRQFLGWRTSVPSVGRRWTPMPRTARLADVSSESSGSPLPRSREKASLGRRPGCESE